MKKLAVFLTLTGCAHLYPHPVPAQAMKACNQMCKAQSMTIYEVSYEEKTEQTTCECR